MMKIFIVFILLGFGINLLGQEVPSRMTFADMDLRLSSGAVRDIQADVDALTRSEKYFQKKLKRVDMYMPIIERIFREEGLPDDFKYLVIQESALIADAVSSSNAVGFWQFKEISALENDLAISKYVDERMNIVSATRAAAMYLKDHNRYFDNWAYALIAYQTGRGGAAKIIDSKNFGDKKLQITKNTYWYLKKYLAHKIAFQNVLGTSKPDFFLQELYDQGGKTLSEISNNFTIEEDLLQEYNKWLKRRKIPTDKNYAVILPIRNVKRLSNIQEKKSLVQFSEYNGENQNDFPKISRDQDLSMNATIAHEVEINGKDGILAAKGYTVTALAEKAGLDEYKFRDFNDMGLRDELVQGMIYYTQRKRNRAKFYYHTVQVGESMWEISQKYALKLKKLYRKNRMEQNEQPRAGRVLWLRHNRPADVPIEYRKVDRVEALASLEKNRKEADKPGLIEEKKYPLKAADSANLEPVVVEKIEMHAEGKSSTVDSSAAVLDSTQNEQPMVEASSLESAKIQKEDSSQLERDSLLVDSSRILDDKKVQVEKSESVGGGTHLDEFENSYDKDKYKVYQIKQGDTFFSLANTFNMKISNLLELNDLKIKDKLAIGQEVLVNNIKVSNADESAIAANNAEEGSSEKSERKSKIDEEKLIEHEVKAGDTLYSLARKYNVSLKEIMQWNNKESAQIKAGEILKIKRK